MKTTKLPTEKVILQAAQAVFFEKGLAGARMQEIADRAGINKALLHYYYRSKDHLSELVIGQAMGLLLRRLLAVLEADLDLFDKIRQLAGEYGAFLSQHRALPLFLLNEVHRNPQFFLLTTLGQQRTRMARFEQQVADAVQAGRIRPISGMQLIMNLVSLLIFPLLGKPILQATFEVSDAAFEAELVRRHTEVADFIIQALRP